MNYYIYILFILLSACGSSNEIPNEHPDKEISWNISPQTVSFANKGETVNIIVDSNGDWEVESNQSWLSLTPTQGYNGQTNVKLTAAANHLTEDRSAQLLFSSGDYSHPYPVSQQAGVEENFVPKGYQLVWQDEFNDKREQEGKPAMPNSAKWWYETAEPGWVNNELQTYVEGVFEGDTVAAIYDGTLKITAKKKGNRVISARLNTTESWTYGYFEAKLKVPGGKGTWPAFWMMPQHFNSWPADGEIDIMEYVGYRPNVVQSSVHTTAYNHVNRTEKTATKSISNAETEFHVYALEWTADYIKGFVDGEEYFHFDNDGQNNKDTWPFYKPFYLKLNLAWGGDWGGSQGIDENKLPAIYEIDYVRVYQK